MPLIGGAGASHAGVGALARVSILPCRVGLFDLRDFVNRETLNFEEQESRLEFGRYPLESSPQAFSILLALIVGLWRASGCFEGVHRFMSLCVAALAASRHALRITP